MTVCRRMWTLLEPIHAVTYFAPEHREAMDAVGLRGGWMAYFASRAAPMGAVSAAVVQATFYNFHPAMVARAIPDAWRFASPDDVLAARAEAMDRALTRLLGDRVDDPRLERVAGLLERVVEAADPAGRPLFAANAALPRPSEAHLRVWAAATCLREHRGDGHVSALVSTGVDGCEAHVLAVAAGRVSEDGIRPLRGWSEQDWADATTRLRARGALGDAALTVAIETRTDALAEPPWAALDRDEVTELIDLLRPISAAAAAVIPYPNPMGVPRPSA